MKFADDFESFLRTEVNLNKDRLDRLQERVDGVEAFIFGHDVFGDLFRDLIPAGSWAHRTIIKPVQANDEFDADVLLYLDERADWLPKEYIEQLYTAFRGSANYKNLARRRTRCVRIDYAGDFHIDVVPYLDRHESHYVTNRKEPEGQGRFELSDPEAFNEWIEERQRLTNGTFVKIVRLVKYLRDFKDTFTCKSIILTTLLGEQVNEIEASNYPARFADVPSTLVTVLERLAASLPLSMPAVMDPAGTGDNFTDRYRDDWDYENFVTRIRSYASKARKAYDETDRHISIALWQDLLGSGFKPGSLAKVASLSPLSASIPWAKEQFIGESPFDYQQAINPAYRARVTARCDGFASGEVLLRNGFRKFSLSSSGNRVRKNRKLVFRASTTVHEPDAIFWKVRNGGEEASARGELRGEITRDQGSLSKTETTQYKGTHYVECYVIKGGVVVARDRQTVIVT